MRETAKRAGRDMLAGYDFMHQRLAGQAAKNCYGSDCHSARQFVADNGVVHGQ
jgi:hypothetical protein